MKHVHLPSALDITCQSLLHTCSLFLQLIIDKLNWSWKRDFGTRLWGICFSEIAIFGQLVSVGCQNIAGFLNFSTFLSYQIWLIPLAMLPSLVWLHHKILKKETWLQLWILLNHYSKLKFGISCTLSSLLFKRNFYFWHFLVETKSKYFYSNTTGLDFVFWKIGSIFISGPCNTIPIKSTCKSGGG
jgi:hypothetical protein